MKWSEIKLAALKKIDPAVASLMPTRNTKDYLNSIIPAANRGLFDLSTAGKFIIKEHCINVPENRNLLAAVKTVQHINDDIAHTKVYPLSRTFLSNRQTVTVTFPADNFLFPIGCMK